MKSNGHYKAGAIQEVIYGKPLTEALNQALSDTLDPVVVFVTNTSLTKTGGLADTVKEVLGKVCISEVKGLKAHSPRQDVITLAKELKATHADIVVTLGGGSVCDTTKVACLALENGVSSKENIGQLAYGELNSPQIKHIAIPTTLSAGEYTGFAGITDETIPRKELFSHNGMVPNVVILDPEMTAATPDRLFFGTGVRAVDHAIETYCSVNTNPLVEASSLHALKLLASALPRCKVDPTDTMSRLECLIGSWLSIQGAANGVDLGASHGIGHILGGTAGMPHGETSCVMLPHVLRYNSLANADNQTVLAAAMGNADLPLADQVQSLVSDLELPGRLRDAGVPEDLLPTLAEESMLDIWIATNPRPLNTSADILKLLEAAW
jgi:maleylacetate reductase